MIILAVQGDFWAIAKARQRAGWALKTMRKERGLSGLGSSLKNFWLKVCSPPSSCSRLIRAEEKEWPNPLLYADFCPPVQRYMEILIPRTYDCDLNGKYVLHRCYQVQAMWVGPNPVGLVENSMWTQKCTWRKWPLCEDGGRDGILLPSQGMPGATWNCRIQYRIFPERLQGKHASFLRYFLGIWPPELWAH